MVGKAEDLEMKDVMNDPVLGNADIRQQLKDHKEKYNYTVTRKLTSTPKGLANAVSNFSPSPPVSLYSCSS